jgi:AraC-like DNA-binding protein
MKPIPLVRRSTLIHCTSSLEKRGFNADLIVTRAAQPMWHHGSSEDWIPFRDAVQLMHLGATVVGDPTFGISVGEEHGYDEFGAFGQTVLAAVSTYDALGKVCRLINRYNSVARYWLSESTDMVWLCRAEPPGMSEIMGQMEQYTVRALIRIVQLSVGKTWTPPEVHLCSRQVMALVDTELFSGTRLRPGQPCTAVAVPRSILVGPPPAERQSLPQAGDDQPLDFVGSIRRLVAGLIRYGDPGIEVVSEASAVSTRTLQRELARAGLTYRELVGQVRYVGATALLDGTSMNLREMAEQLGYATETQFIRAFRRWAGVTPASYRRARQLQLAS